MKSDIDVVTRNLTLAPLTWLIAFPASLVGYYKLYWKVADPASGVVLFFGTIVGLGVAYVVAFALLRPLIRRIELRRNRTLLLLPALIVTCAFVALLVAMALQVVMNQAFLVDRRVTGETAVLFAIPAICCCITYEVLRQAGFRGAKGGARGPSQ